ncbi:MAG: PKD domain-containing protein [Arcticibacter sp.]
MKRSIKNIYLFAFVLVACTFSACEKEESEIQTDLLYEVAVEGNQATFKVKTTGVSGYRWEFGDGETSTEPNPTHTYPGKGKYVPTLYATVEGKMVEASTVLRIAKTTPVKINDNTLDDWATVSNSITLGGTKGVFNEVKMDYDGNYVYVYVDMVGRKANGDIFDFYIDSDNNPATGLLTGTFTEGGYDILLEGQLLTAGVDIFYHNSTDQNAFSFAQQSIAEAYQVGTVSESGANVRFEMRIARGKLKGLTGSGLRIAIQAIKSDWSAVLGSAPDEGTASFRLDMSE